MVIEIKKGNNSFEFQGQTPDDSSSIEIRLKKGFYFIELYGASGGGLKGGYWWIYLGVLEGIQTNECLPFYWWSGTSKFIEYT